MQKNIRDAFDLMSTIKFLSTFKRACDRNRIHEDAAMWLLPLLLRKPALDALNSKIALSSELCQYHKERTLTSYSKVVIYFLEAYTTEAFIAKMNAEILRSTQLSKMTPTKYAIALRNKAPTATLSMMNTS